MTTARTEPPGNLTMGNLVLNRRNRRRRIADPMSDRAYYVVAYGVLAMLTISVVYPLVYVLSSSFSSGAAIRRGDVKLWPVDVNVDAYRTIWHSPDLVRGFVNSVIYAVAGAFIGTALTLLAAYPLTRADLPFRRFLTFFFLIPTIFSAGIIPTYVIVKDLGLLDTRWAIILPGAMQVFNLIVSRAYYQLSLPRELLEAAKVDGATDLRFFWQIALPLSKPIIAVNMLFYAVTQWNSWFSAFIYLTNEHLYPLQLVLRQILAQSSIDPSQVSGANLEVIRQKKELFDKLKYALIVVAMVPPLVAYPFVQKHFIKGALLGSLK